MLWLNLIMDTLGSLALATEPPNEKVLDRKPYDRTEYIINKNIFKLILGTALVMITVILIIVFAGDSFLPEVHLILTRNYFGNLMILNVQRQILILKVRLHNVPMKIMQIVFVEPLMNVL